MIDTDEILIKKNEEFVKDNVARANLHSIDKSSDLSSQRDGDPTP